MYVFPFYAALAASGGLPVLPLVIAILAIVCVVLFFVLKGRGPALRLAKPERLGRRRRMWTCPPWRRNFWPLWGKGERDRRGLLRLPCAL